MGGESSSTIKLNEKRDMVFFWGTFISLDNNGGFSSVNIDSQ
jgi:hypothetical protein